MGAGEVRGPSVSLHIHYKYLGRAGRWYPINGHSTRAKTFVISQVDFFLFGLEYQFPIA